MVIRSSTAREVAHLLTELRHDDPIRREAAIARLRVLGSRSLARLGPFIEEERDPGVRAAAVRALDGIDDPHGLELALPRLTDPHADVRLSAILAVRAWVPREAGTRLLDALATIALDEREGRRIRTAALDALSQLPAAVVAPIVERSASVTGTGTVPAAEEPAGVQDWLGSHGDAPLSELHDLIVRLRERESAEPLEAVRREWLVTRGAVHTALARRDSRVALYDLREAFDAAETPLPLDFLTAAAAIGDASCLEPLARAWAAAPAHETWWKEQLAETAATIMRRNGLTGRAAAVKRIKSKWPAFIR